MASNPTCHTYIPLLSPLVDGELSAADRQAVQTHLAACAACQARSEDLRAQSGLLRYGLDVLADEEDFSDFAQQVMARLTPERPPLVERLRLTLSEIFTHQRWQLATGTAFALLAVVALTGWLLRPGGLGPREGYGQAQLAVQSVTTDDEAKVAPVVMKTQAGDTIIWTVAPPQNESPDAGTPHAPKPLQQERPTGGEL